MCKTCNMYYLDAGHMELVTGTVFHYYIPYHCVLISHRCVNLLNDTFVYDILTRGKTENDAFEYQSQLIKLCSLAKFELQK